MYPKLYSADKGEFVQFDSEGVGHDKFLSSLLVEATPSLKKCAVSYSVAERVDQEDDSTIRYFGKQSYVTPWMHFKAMLRLSEDFEFYSEQAASLITFSTNNYITNAGANIEHPGIVENDDIVFDPGLIAEVPPNQRMSPTKVFMHVVIKEGEQGLGFYPEIIAAAFLVNGAKLTYRISWDLYYNMVVNPNPRMVLGVDFIFDEQLKCLDVIKPD